LGFQLAYAVIFTAGVCGKFYRRPAPIFTAGFCCRKRGAVPAFEVERSGFAIARFIGQAPVRGDAAAVGAEESIGDFYRDAIVLKHSQCLRRGFGIDAKQSGCVPFRHVDWLLLVPIVKPLHFDVQRAGNWLHRAPGVGFHHVGIDRREGGAEFFWFVFHPALRALAHAILVCGPAARVWCAVALVGVLLIAAQLGVEYFSLDVGRYDGGLAELDQFAIDIFDRTRWRFGLPAAIIAGHPLHAQMPARFAFAERIAAAGLGEARFVCGVRGPLIGVERPCDHIVGPAVPVHAAAVIQNDDVRLALGWPQAAPDHLPK